jgi:hypothetical protein
VLGSYWPTSLRTSLTSTVGKLLIVVVIHGSFLLLLWGQLPGVLLFLVVVRLLCSLVLLLSR